MVPDQDFPFKVSFAALYHRIAKIYSFQISSTQQALKQIVEDSRNKSIISDFSNPPQIASSALEQPQVAASALQSAAAVISDFSNHAQVAASALEQAQVASSALEQPQVAASALQSAAAVETVEAVVENSASTALGTKA